MTSWAVEAADLRVRRGGRDVLHGLTFTVARGTIAGLLGPSGGGKTTVMRAVVGVQAGVRGRVEVLGAPAGSPALRARVGYVTQSPAVYPDLSVRSNLDYFAALLGEDAGRVRTVLRDGRLVADDTVAGLLERTATSDVEAAFLALAEGAVA